MNSQALKAIKIAVSVASIGVTLATSYFADKELENKVAKKVAEQLAKVGKES